MQDSEIKFRAWDLDENKMFLVDKLSEAEWVLYLSNAIKGKGRPVFQQYTGLKDKNGKEIYEGDVVCLVEDVVVENIGGYDRTEPEGKFIEVKIPDFFIKVNDEFEPSDVEIIGNMYENPELLAVK